MFTPTEVIACSTCDLHFCNVPCTRRSSCPHIEDTDVDAEAAYPELFAGHGCQWTVRVLLTSVPATLLLRVRRSNARLL